MLTFIEKRGVAAPGNDRLPIALFERKWTVPSSGPRGVEANNVRDPLRSTMFDLATPALCS